MALLADVQMMVRSYWPVGVVLLTVAYATKQIYFTPLRDIPGPWLAKVTRLWQTFQVIGGASEKTEIALHEKYGKFVRVAPNQVSIADPDAIKVIYGPNSKFMKTDMYAAWQHGAENMFTYRDPELHAIHRRLVGNTYAMSSVLDSETYVNKCSELFIERLGEFADQGKPIDLGTWLQMYTFDIVTELMFGKAFGLLEARNDFGWIELLDGVVEAVAIMGTVPFVAPWFHMPIWQRIFPSVQKSSAQQGQMITTAQERVAARLEKDAERKDILEKLLEKHKANPSLTRDMVTTEAVVALFAGSDTTAIALRSIFYFLLKNPATYQKLQDEIDAMDSQGNLSATVAFAESMKMPYLLAVCKEAMRLHPSVGQGLPRYVPAGGKEICGKFFQEGTRVAINAFVVHLDEGVFGKNPKAFRPERWIEGDARMMDRYFFTFGDGSRSCTGKHIATLEMQKIVPQILRKYKVSLVEPEKEWKTVNHFFIKQLGLNVELERRASKV